jgi:hypothetical protein
VDGQPTGDRLRGEARSPPDRYAEAAAELEPLFDVDLPLDVSAESLEPDASPELDLESGLESDRASVLVEPLAELFAGSRLSVR